MDARYDEFHIKGKLTVITKTTIKIMTHLTLQWSFPCMTTPYHQEIYGFNITFYLKKNECARGQKKVN